MQWIQSTCVGVQPSPSAVAGWVDLKKHVFRVWQIRKVSISELDHSLLPFISNTIEISGKQETSQRSHISPMFPINFTVQKCIGSYLYTYYPTSFNPLPQCGNVHRCLDLGSLLVQWLGAGHQKALLAVELSFCILTGLLLLFQQKRRMLFFIWS